MVQAKGRKTRRVPHAPFGRSPCDKARNHREGGEFRDSEHGHCSSAEQEQTHKAYGEEVDKKERRGQIIVVVDFLGQGPGNGGEEGADKEVGGGDGEGEAGLYEHEPICHARTISFRFWRLWRRT